MEDLLLWNHSQTESYPIGWVIYDAIPDNIRSTISHTLDPADTDQTHFELRIGQNSLQQKPNVGIQKMLKQLIEWVESIDHQKVLKVKKVTYNWITEGDVNSPSDETCYIITLFGDDWIGTYLAVDCDGWSTVKYTRSDSLYPDEREENQHYYDGGCLIKIDPTNEFRNISASNCLIFHLI